MRYGQVEFDSVINGGLPVYVHATIYPPEPDTGSFSAWVEIEDIYWQPKKGIAHRYSKKLRSIPKALFDRAMIEDREYLEREALEV